jgi:hypothetical protein
MSLKLRVIEAERNQISLKPCNIKTKRIDQISIGKNYNETEAFLFCVIDGKKESSERLTLLGLRSKKDKTRKGVG